MIITVAPFVESFCGCVFIFEDCFGQKVKATLVHRPEHDIICLPSQLGCAGSCVFCYTGNQRNNSVKNLASHHLYRFFCEIEPYTRNPKILVSFMGDGDPCENSYNIVKAAHSITALRPHVSLALATTAPNSIDKAINLFAELEQKAPLSVTISLHAGTPQTRKVILGTPSAKSPQRLIEAFGNRVKYNYVVVKGVNDSDEEVLAINKWTKGAPLRIKINNLNKIGVDGMEQGVLNTSLFAENINIEYYKTDASTVHGACGQMGLFTEEVVPCSPISE